MNTAAKIAMMRNIIENTNGKIAVIKFMKKNGEIRTMQFRTGVKSGLVENPRICSNGTSDTTAHMPEYFNVFDMVVAAEESARARADGATPEQAKAIAAKKAWRKINCATVTYFKSGELELTIG